MGKMRVEHIRCPSVIDALEYNLYLGQYSKYFQGALTPPRIILFYGSESDPSCLICTSWKEVFWFPKLFNVPNELYALYILPRDYKDEG